MLHMLYAYILLPLILCGNDVAEWHEMLLYLSSSVGHVFQCYFLHSMIGVAADLFAYSRRNIAHMSIDFEYFAHYTDSRKEKICLPRRIIGV
jgi:hypothetical protein